MFMGKLPLSTVLCSLSPSQGGPAQQDPTPFDQRHNQSESSCSISSALLSSVWASGSEPLCSLLSKYIRTSVPPPLPLCLPRPVQSYGGISLAGTRPVDQSPDSHSGHSALLLPMNSRHSCWPDSSSPNTSVLTPVHPGLVVERAVLSHVRSCMGCRKASVAACPLSRLLLSSCLISDHAEGRSDTLLAAMRSQWRPASLSSAPHGGVALGWKAAAAK